MQKRPIFAGAMLAIVLGSAVGSAQQPDDLMVVVLNNYGVIRGEVTSTDEGLNVQTQSGSTAVLRLNQVACLAESLDSAYEQLLAATDRSDVQKLGRLFDWCLQNGLQQRAVELLVQAQSAKVDPGELKLWERRLENFETQTQRAKIQAWPSSTEFAVEKPRATTQQIDDVITSLPDGAEAMFNQKLHAKLVIGCTAAKCHERESESMALWHHGKGIATPRGFTRHNLYEVMQFVDPVNPSASKILTMATTAHGGQSKPGFEQTSATFQLLQHWTYAVSEHPEKYASDLAQSASPRALEKTPPEPAAPTQDVISQVGFIDDSSTPAAPPQTSAQPTAETFVPTDPCDPSLFNRQHHPAGNRK